MLPVYATQKHEVLGPKKLTGCLGSLTQPTAGTMRPHKALHKTYVLKVAIWNQSQEIQIRDMSELPIFSGAYTSP